MVGKIADKGRGAANRCAHANAAAIRSRAIDPECVFLGIHDDRADAGVAERLGRRGDREHATGIELHLLDPVDA